MAINPLSSAGPASIAGAGTTPKVGQSFGQVMKALSSPQQVMSVGQAAAGVTRAGAPGPGVPPAAAKMLDRVSQAQNRMDQILKLAESGKSFSPAELLSLQAHVYRASQELDLAGKVVEKATGGIKQVLQTQV